MSIQQLKITTKWVVAAWALAAACAPRTCSDRDDVWLARAIEILVEDDGQGAREAHALIVDRGFEAIALLETAIYGATESGRRRVVRALVDVGHPEVVPILKKLSEVDAAESVRQEALRGLSALSARGPIHSP